MGARAPGGKGVLENPFLVKAGDDSVHGVELYIDLVQGESRVSGNKKGKDGSNKKKNYGQEMQERRRRNPTPCSAS